MTAMDQPLASEFGVATEADWRRLVDTVLKGGDFDKRLVARTYDGVRIQPLSPAARSAAPILRAGAGQPWAVATRVDHPDAGEAAAVALADLEGGADTLVLVGRGARTARGFGIDLSQPDTLARALSPVMLDLIRIRLEARPDQCDAAVAAMAEIVRSRGLAPAAVRIDFGIDPLALFFATGERPSGGRLAARVARLVAEGFAGPFVACDTRSIHEAGGTEAQELGLALGIAVATARALTTGAAALSIDAAYRALSFTLAIDADQLLGIAKLRALRRLMSRVQAASGVTPGAIAIHAETAWRMQTRRDPAVTMLRATMAVFSAGVGGADSITVLPHTSALGLPDRLARRIARNTQLVALEEAGLAAVADPSAGSGAIEALTEDLARAAWTVFQEIEAAGGVYAALERGDIQVRVAATAAARMRDVATRRLAITGTSEFPNLAEQPAAVLDVAADHTVQHTTTSIAPLPSRRLAEPFEVLRDAADAHLAATAKPPTVFVAALGALADHGPRTLWVVNALAAGGIAALPPGDGYTASAAAGRAFAESGAAVACITGTDVAYAELAEATAGVLKAAGATHVVLAGRPGGTEATLRAAGVDGFLYAGQDLVEALTRLQRDLGVAGVSA